MRHEINLGDIVPLCILSIEYLFLLADIHNYIDLCISFYLILLHASAVNFSHHQVGHYFIKRVSREASAYKSRCEFIAKLLYQKQNNK